MRFRGKETEFTAESKCVSFPVCTDTNANYLISQGGADVKNRIVKHSKPTEGKKLLNVHEVPVRPSTATFVSEELKVSSHKSTISHLKFLHVITRDYFRSVWTCRCSLPKCQLLSEWKKIEADSSYGVGEFLYFHSLKGSSVSDYNGYLIEQAICLMKNAVQSFRDREKVDSIPKNKWSLATGSALFQTGS